MENCPSLNAAAKFSVPEPKKIVLEARKSQKNEQKFITEIPDFPSILAPKYTVLLRIHGIVFARTSTTAQEKSPILP